MLSMTIALLVYGQSEDYPVVGKFTQGFYDSDGKILLFECDVLGTPAEDGNFGVLIQASTGKNKDYIGLRKDQISGFKKSLTQVQSRLSEWNNVARQNNVVDFQKDLNVDFDNVALFFGREYYQGIGVCTDAHLQICTYFVDELGYPDVDISFYGEIVDGESSGENGSASLIFSRPSDMQTLIDVLDLRKLESSMESFIRKASSRDVDDLFKY